MSPKDIANLNLTITSCNYTSPLSAIVLDRGASLAYEAVKNDPYLKLIIN